MLPFQVSQQAPSTMDRIANALQGFGAGVAGRGGEFLKNQQLQRQALSDERKQAAAEDLRRAKALIDKNDLKGLQALGQERLGYINQLGGDPSDTEQLIVLAQQAETDPIAYQRLLAEVNSGLRSAADAGFIKLDTAAPMSPAGKVQYDIEKGFLTKEQGENAKQGMTAESQSFNYLMNIIKDPNASDEEKRAARVALGLAERGDPKALSPEAQTVLTQTINDYSSASKSYNQMQNLLAGFLKNQDQLTSGVFASAEDLFSNILGTENYDTFLRTTLRGVINSEVMQNLPPGVASDKDIELARSGFPKATNDPKIIQEFLSAASRVAKAGMMYSEFKANYLNDNPNLRGFLPAWKKYIKTLSDDSENNVNITSLTVQDVAALNSNDIAALTTDQIEALIKMLQEKKK